MDSPSCLSAISSSSILNSSLVLVCTSPPILSLPHCLKRSNFLLTFILARVSLWRVRIKYVESGCNVLSQGASWLYKGSSSKFVNGFLQEQASNVTLPSL